MCKIWIVRNYAENTANGKSLNVSLLLYIIDLYSCALPSNYVFPFHGKIVVYLRFKPSLEILCHLSFGVSIVGYSELFTVTYTTKFYTHLVAFTCWDFKIILNRSKSNAFMEFLTFMSFQTDLYLFDDSIKNRCYHRWWLNYIQNSKERALNFRVTLINLFEK